MLNLLWKLTPLWLGSWFSGITGWVWTRIEEEDGTVSRYYFQRTHDMVLMLDSKYFYIYGHPKFNDNYREFKIEFIKPTYKSGLNLTITYDYWFVSISFNKGG